MEVLNKYKEYEWFKELDFSKELIALKEIESFKEEFVPKIALIGEFSAGKSSIINNMLEEDILPIGWEPETKYITIIKYADENYILVDNKKEELTTENIKKIKTDVNKIEIYMNNPILKEVTFVDTPGTNDPNTFNDNIVFDVVSNVDIVLFITKATQALTGSEKRFLSKVIKQKDLEKFFFIINFADTVEERKKVKNEFVNNLSTLLTLDKQIIQEQTLLYSVKEKQIYGYVLEHLIEHVNKKRDLLMAEWEKNQKNAIIDQMLVKIEFLLDSIDGKVSSYDKELNQINKEIELFEQNIESELQKLQQQIENLKKSTIQNLTAGFNNIKKMIENEVSQIDYNQLANSRYMELRVKKLVEDLVENEWKYFIKSMSKLIEDFDREIDTNVLNSLSLPSLETKKSKKVVNLAAMATAGVGAVAALPAIEGGLATASILGGLIGASPMLAVIPVVGPILAGVGAVSSVALPAIGAFALGAGKILFDVAKWGVGKAGDLAEIAEEKVYKKKYISAINKQLDKLLKDLVAQIQIVNLEEFKENYIKTKFPQKQLLEEKIKMLKDKKVATNYAIQEEKNEVLKLYNEVVELKNEL